MNVVERWRDDIARIFAEAAEDVASLPAGPSAVGLALLERADPLRGAAGTNAISYLLPFWLRERLDVPIGASRDMAVGNLLAMLHFFGLDDAMDERHGERRRADLRDTLTFGQLANELFRQRYSRHFPSDSPLWSYHRRYLEEWASAVQAEAAAPIDPRDPERLAAKAAPVKLCAAAGLLHEQRRERIPELERAVQLALAVLQLSDDWADWREDLAEPNRNALLSLARDGLALTDGEPMDERSVRRAIYRGGCADRLADIAEGYVVHLQRCDMAPPSLVEFAREIAQGIRRDAQAVERSVAELAAGGGLSYYLSNNGYR